jgi:HYR domain-containing protein
VNADRLGGAVVTYPSTVTDNLDANPTITCVPASGSIFPFGMTEVRCSGSDAAGNEANAAFGVYVAGPKDQLLALIGIIANVRSGVQGVTKNLLTLASNALLAISTGNTTEACKNLTMLIDQATIQKGKALDATDAGQIIQAASQIKQVIGC